MAAPKKPDAGDLSAQREAALQEQKEQAQQEARSRLTMITAEKAEAARVGVFDPGTGQRVDIDSAEETPEYEVVGGPTTPVIDYVDPEPIQTQQTVSVVDSGVQVMEQPFVIVRVNESIDQMTYGAGNHYTFVAGQRYRVPRDVAEHLEEAGLVWH
jgi:hypothetical protein